jgi:hypothetical protein
VIKEDVYHRFGWLVKHLFVCRLDDTILFLFSSGTVIIQLLWTGSEITEGSNWQEE